MYLSNGTKNQEFGVSAFRFSQNQVRVHVHRPILTRETPGLLEMKNADKYWTETAASREFGIPSTTLRHAWVRGDIETVTTACGLTLLYGPSVRKYAKRHKPQIKITSVRRRRTAIASRGPIHAVPDSAVPEGRALCGRYAPWGPAIKEVGKEFQISCERCKERAARKKIS